MKVSSSVRKELLSLSIRNAGRSIPVLLLGAAVVTWNGIDSAKLEVALGVAALAVAICLWRVALAKRFAGAGFRHGASPRRFYVELVLCSLLAGVMWAVATFGMYPALGSEGKALHLVAVTGLVALACHFMSLVKWSYVALVIPALGSLVTVSLVEADQRSPLMAALLALYALVALRAGKHYREATTSSIEQRIALEEANQDLVCAKNRADDAASATSRFLATMSHEIRTPMNGVLGSLDILRRSRLAETEMALVRGAAACGESLVALLNDALDQAKVEAGRIELHLAPTSLHSTVATAIDIFQSTAQSKGVQIILVIDESVPEWVVIDAHRVKQVLLNLVSNAVKFTSSGAVRVRLSNAGESGSLARVLFEVQDSGRGMTEDELDRLFLPFSQVNQEAGTQVGTGLGLYISRALVELMGGQLQAQSEPGIGTVFRFTLDLSAHAPLTAQNATRLERPSVTLDAMSLLEGDVLVVDDDGLNRLVARSMLESFGLRVVDVPDGVDALAAVSEHEFDLILMDCHMPGMDGYACTRRLRDRETADGRPRVPIIALTATAFRADVNRALESGMDAHLSKPYSRLQLRNEVAQWL